MDFQLFTIKGSILGFDDPEMQVTLAQIHGTPERPRCSRAVGWICSLLIICSL